MLGSEDVDNRTEKRKWYLPNLCSVGGFVLVLYVSIYVKRLTKRNNEGKTEHQRQVVEGIQAVHLKTVQGGGNKSTRKQLITSVQRQFVAF